MIRGLGLVLFYLSVISGGSIARADDFVIGAKNFAENRLLAEMGAQLIEARTDHTVGRQLELAGTRICFEHLRGGKIHIYPEYTGTGLVEILTEPPIGDALAARALVRREFLARHGLRWLPPLGFENAYEIAVSKPVAEKHSLRTISDLARVSGELTAGFGAEFMEREDGVPGLARAYGLEFRDKQTMQQAIKYEAVARGTIDCLDVYTTQGRLVEADVVILEDDRNFFPPYEAAFLVSDRVAMTNPEVAFALSELSGTLDRRRMQRLNHRIESEGESTARVATAALRELGLLDSTNDPTRSLSRDGSWVAYLWDDRAEIARRTWEHLWLTFVSVGLAALVAIPVGLGLERYRPLSGLTLRAFGMAQTVPSLALLVLMLTAFSLVPGLDRSLAAPAIAALWLYAIFPILNNTFVGLRDADTGAVAAATALGMTRGQVLTRVRLPLALPVILTGVRTASVIAVGNATLGAFIGAGGLGVPIIQGIQLFHTNMLLSGAIPAALLALIVDGLLSLLERRLRPPGPT